MMPKTLITSLINSKIYIKITKQMHTDTCPGILVFTWVKKETRHTITYSLYFYKVTTWPDIYLSIKWSPWTGSPCFISTVSKMNVSLLRLISRSFFSLVGMCEKNGWESMKSLISANSFSVSNYKREKWFIQ